MKTQTGYIYPEGISAERKPTLDDFTIDKIYLSIRFDTIAYGCAIEEWEKTLIPATNIFYCHLNKVWCITRPHPEYRWEFTPGTKVEHNKGTVTKIL